MPTIGRNDPCPCGSGRKYKKCCQGSDRDPAPETNSLTFAPADRDAARSMMTELFDAWKDYLLEAQRRFYGGLSEHAMEELSDVDRRLSGSVCLMWCCFDHELESGGCLADELLDGRAGIETDPGIDAYLLSARASWLKLYYVDAKPSRGVVTLRDAHTDETVQARLPKPDTHIVPGLVAARVLSRGPSQIAELDDGLLVYPQERIESVLNAVQEGRAHLYRAHPKTTESELCRWEASTLHHFWACSDETFHVWTSSRHSAVLETRDAEALRAALDQRPDVFQHDALGDNRAWLDRPRGGEVTPDVLAVFEFVGDTVIARADTRERAEWARELLEGLVPGNATFLRMEVEG